MKRLIFGIVLVLLLCGCREEGIIIETMKPSPSTSATESVATTEAKIEATAEMQTQTAEGTQETTIPEGGGAYVLNTSSKKFHLPSCGSAATIKAENRKETNATRDDLMAQGYVPCGRCDP